MASFITKGQQICQNENLNILQKKLIDGKSEVAKTKAKKGGPGLGSRKALKDITNKSVGSQKVPTADKQKIPEKDFNIAEEGFLHNHNKCIEAQKKANDVFLLDLVLPGYDCVVQDKPLVNDQEKAGFDSPLCLSDMDEYPMDEFSDWFKSPSRWKSPSCSPRWSYSPPDSPFSWQYEKIEFTLKEEDI